MNPIKPPESTPPPEPGPRPISSPEPAPVVTPPFATPAPIEIPAQPVFRGARTGNDLGYLTQEPAQPIPEPTPTPDRGIELHTPLGDVTRANDEPFIDEHNIHPQPPIEAIEAGSNQPSEPIPVTAEQQAQTPIAPSPFPSVEPTTLTPPIVPVEQQAPLPPLPDSLTPSGMTGFAVPAASLDELDGTKPFSTFQNTQPTAQLPAEKPTPTKEPGWLSRLFGGGK